MSRSRTRPTVLCHRASLSMFQWDRNAPERRSGPFKTTRLVVKLHQAYVLASEGGTGAHWGSLQRSPDSLAALKLLAPSPLDPRRLRRLAWRLRRSETEHSGYSFSPFEHCSLFLKSFDVFASINLDTCVCVCAVYSHFTNGCDVWRSWQSGCAMSE